jgi:hypothetical protein
MKLVLIDDRIEKETFLINSFNSDCVIKNIKDYQNSSQSISEIENIEEITHFAMIYFFEGEYDIPYFKESGESNYKFFNIEIMNLITLFKGYNPEIKIDILTCNMNNPEFVQTVAKIEEDFEIDIRFSLDQTGNNPQGNWILESDGVNIRDIYFNDSINLWKNKLDLLTAVWVQKGGDLYGETAEDQFGYSVSLSSNGNTVAIGAHLNDGNGTNSGHVRIYDWSENSLTWTQRGSDIDGAENNQSGFAISLNSTGNTVAIGAPQSYMDQYGNSNGSVRIFDWSENSWMQRGSNIEGIYGSQSGYSVSLSSNGNTVAIGAPSSDTPLNSGSVKIYDWINNSWTQRGSIINGEEADDQSGYSISLSSDGNTIAIGAPYNDGNNLDRGHVRIYDWNGSSWTQRGSDIDGEEGWNNSGKSISLSSNGNTIAISSPEDTSLGSIRILDWNGSSWTQRGSKIYGEAINDHSGYSISLSSDGNIFAISSITHSNNKGNVRIYNWNGSNWSKIGSTIYGEDGDYSGTSISLSSDGNIIAIGAPFNSTNAYQSGRVKIFESFYNPISHNFSKNVFINSLNNQIDLSGTTFQSTFTSYKITSITDISATHLKQTSGGASIVLNTIYSGTSLYFSPSSNMNGTKYFTYTLIDDNGLETNESTVTLNLVIDPSPIYVNTSTFTLLSSYNGSNATITVDISGGNRVYTNYSWTKNGSPFPDVSTNLTNLSSGFYILNSVSDSSNSTFIYSNNKFTIPNLPVVLPDSIFLTPALPPLTRVTFPQESLTPDLVFSESTGINLSNKIDNIINSSTDSILVNKLQTGNNIKILTLEPSGTTFSKYFEIPLKVTSTDGLFIFFVSGPNSELLSLSTPNTLNGPYYDIVSSTQVIVYTKHFSEIGFGYEFGGIGDPFIKPIFGNSYYLPNDENTYLLLDNNDNLKIYTKTWIPINLNKKVSFMRYLIFDFNLERFCLDLESMNFVSPNDSYKYISHKLSPIADPNLTDLFINRSPFTNCLNDYYGKNYKISSKNKQITIKFNCNKENEIILLINSDLKYTDIRNNVNIKFVNIPIHTLREYNGAFINEQKVKCIKYENTIIKKLFN